MKNYSLLAMLSFCIISLSACEKTYDCICKDRMRNNETIDQFNYHAKSAPEAELKCIDKETAYNKLPMYDYVHCTVY